MRQQRHSHLLGVAPVPSHGHIASHDEGEHRAAAHRALLVSALGLAVTGGTELAVAGFTHSVGLLGDALHNLSDVSSSLLLLAGFWVSKRPPSPAYPFGYERAEDVAGIGVALAIWVSAAVAAFESVQKLIHHGSTVHLAWGMAAAAIGVAGNQAVGWYKGRIGRRIRSVTLIADARHSWLDAVSSFGALIGLFAVALGFPVGDPIAGFAITLMMCHVGYQVTGEIISRLMDGLDPEILHHAEHGALGVPEVRAAAVRGRWAGRSLRLEVTAEVESTLTVAAWQPVQEAVRNAVAEAVIEAREVVVHPAVRKESRTSP